VPRAAEKGGLTGTPGGMRTTRHERSECLLLVLHAQVLSRVQLERSLGYEKIRLTLL